MSKLRILVTGANGQLAKCIKDELQKPSNKNIKAVFLTHEELDITDMEKLDTYLYENSGWKFNYLINCAAYTNVNGAEDPSIEQGNAIKVNGLAPLYLAHMCEKYKITLIHISTDYVFPGLAKALKESTEGVDPLNNYGKTKLIGEKNIIETADQTNLQYMIIRTSWLYSEYGNNFVKSIIKQFLADKDLNVIYDQVGSPTNAHDLADFIINTIVSKNRLAHDAPELKSGIYHFANDGVISWFDFAKAIVEMYIKEAKNEGVFIFNENPTIRPILEADILYMMSSNDKPLVHRPCTSIFDKTNTKSTGYEFRYWKDSLKDVICKIIETLDK